MCWNIRGLEEKGRIRQLKELISKHRADIICLQETMKTNYSISEQKNLVRDQSFTCSWTTAQGHWGGVLVGVPYMH
jgi:exonuclease III